MSMFRILAFIALAIPVAAVHAEEIPLEDLYRLPEVTSLSLSPTGKYFTVSVPQEDRTVLAAFRVEDMELIGKWDYGRTKHIDAVVWVTDERFFMYVSRKTGRFDGRNLVADLYATNVDGTGRADIHNGATYAIVDMLEKDDDKILVQRSVDSAFLFKMDVDDGSVTPVAQSGLYFGSFMVDHDDKLRYAIGTSEEREIIVLRRDGDSWTEVSRTPETKTERLPIGFAADNRHLYYSISRENAPDALVLVDPETGTETPISSNSRVDPSGRIYGDNGRKLLAVRYHDGLPAYDFVAPDDPQAQLLAGLVNAFPDHAVDLVDSSRDGRFVLLRAYSDVDPGSVYVFDRDTGKAKYLLSAMPWLKSEQLSMMEPVSFQARDGTRVHGYLTLPRGSDGKNLPLVLFIHGGPTARDYWGFNQDVQFLANRGYAVLQVNYRGSTGYGSEFMLAGDKHWGTTMIDDMADGVDWAIAKGIADRHRICTYGASYGGYAALQSIVRYPDKYQCTIGYVGVYSLPLMRKDGDIRETKYGMGQLSRQLPASAAEQQAQSPALNADRIKVPVMLVHGAKDERVPIAHYELMKEKLTEAGNPPEVTIVEAKEGHGFANVGNNIDLYTAMEAFLDKHIGDGAQRAASAD